VAVVEAAVAAVKTKEAVAAVAVKTKEAVAAVAVVKMAVKAVKTAAVKMKAAAYLYDP
jgi:hypothetical protein